MQSVRAISFRQCASIAMAFGDGACIRKWFEVSRQPKLHRNRHRIIIHTNIASNKNESKSPKFKAINICNACTCDNHHSDNIVSLSFAEHFSVHILLFYRIFYFICSLFSVLCCLFSLYHRFILALFEWEIDQSEIMMISEIYAN